jgi:hypothetical protein
MLCETVGVMLFAIGFLAEAIVDLGDRMQSQIDRLGKARSAEADREPSRRDRGRRRPAPSGPPPQAPAAP